MPYFESDGKRVRFPDIYGDKRDDITACIDLHSGL